MTRNTVAAIPRVLQEVVDLNALFPGFTAFPLTDHSVLENAPFSGSLFYYAFYDQMDACLAWLILVDVPDFNTVERQNWDKAEKMLRRSETVIFVVHPEAYKDEAVVSQLHACCCHAGFLAYVLTKVPSENAFSTAEEIWRDLMKFVKHDPRFQATRADGRTAETFLESAVAYFAPRSSSLNIQQIQPMHAGSPDFTSLLKGHSGIQIYWSNLLETAGSGISSVALLAESALETQRSLEQALELVEGRLSMVGQRIAGLQFPAGELVETIIQTIKTSRPRWLRMISLPLSSVAGLFSSTKALLARLRSRDHKQMLKDRAVLEKERLIEAVEVLVAQWRSDFSSESMHGLLKVDNCRRVVAAFAEKQLPEPHSEWKKAIHQDVQRWVQKNPWYGSVLGTLSEMLVLLGGAALVLDLAFSGGLTHLGVGAAAGAGSVGAGTVLKLFEELKMKDILEKADRKWRTQRAHELTDHLRKHLADPLVGNAWRDKLNKIIAADPSACLRACESLRTHWMTGK